MSLAIIEIEEPTSAGINNNLLKRPREEPIQEQPENKKNKKSERMISTYCDEIYSDKNLEETRSLVKTLLSSVRDRRNLKDDQDFLWIAKESKLLPNNRDLVTDDDMRIGGAISLFGLNIRGLDINDHEFKSKFLWLMRQNDGYSCSAASIFTCTAGYAKIPPSKVTEVHQYVTKNNPWQVENEQMLPDLPHEGMGRLIHETLGIIPVVMHGRVAQEKEKGEWETIDEADNLFNDEKRFTKLMRLVRFASICCNSPFHWYSLTCVPYGPEPDEVFFVVCDSLKHTEALAYPSYYSFRRFFLLSKTRPSPYNPTLNIFPIALSFYPVLQTQNGNDRTVAAFMEKVIHSTIDYMDKNEVPFFGWPDMANLLDSV